VIAKDVVIITSGMVDQAPRGQVDQMIRLIRSVRKNTILVVGPDGDDLLRSNVELDHCDFVFDPNFSGSIFSSIKAGLHASQGACFVISLLHSAFDRTHFAALEAALRNQPAATDVLRLATRPSENPIQTGLELITRPALDRLKSLPSETLWDPSSPIVFVDVLGDVAADVFAEVEPGVRFTS
jgi:hypothetical protein